MLTGEFHQTNDVQNVYRADNHVRTFHYDAFLTLTTAWVARLCSEAKHSFHAEAQLMPQACCLVEAILTKDIVGHALRLEGCNNLPGRTEQSYELVWHQWNG